MDGWMDGWRMKEMGWLHNETQQSTKLKWYERRYKGRMDCLYLILEFCTKGVINRIGGRGKHIFFSLFPIACTKYRDYIPIFPLLFFKIT